MGNLPRFPLPTATNCHCSSGKKINNTGLREKNKPSKNNKEKTEIRLHPVFEICPA